MGFSSSRWKLHSENPKNLHGSRVRQLQMILQRRSMAKTKPNGPNCSSFRTYLDGKALIVQSTSCVWLNKKMLKTSLNKKSQKILNLEATTFKICQKKKKKNIFWSPHHLVWGFFSSNPNHLCLYTTLDPLTQVVGDHDTCGTACNQPSKIKRVTTVWFCREFSDPNTTRILTLQLWRFHSLEIVDQIRDARQRRWLLCSAASQWI